jgi:hypothetical protein
MANIAFSGSAFMMGSHLKMQEVTFEAKGGIAALGVSVT